jgi:cutinase
MKLQTTLVSVFGVLAAAAPLQARDGISDTANDMSDIVAGDASCAPVAVIFARGTFDSGYVLVDSPHFQPNRD